MKIYLVRQGRSVERADWVGGDDELRPLSEAGREQAARLAEHFRVDPPTRIIAAPAVRCQQTVQPLAAALGIEVEIDERLAHGEPPSRPLELLPTFDEGPLMLCTHGDIIGAILQHLELTDSDRSESRKGSVWVLEGVGYTPTHASYVEPARSVRRRRVLDAAGGSSDVVRAAVLDLGSTSFNLLVADVTSQGSIAPVIREKVMLRLGAVIADGGSIPEAVCERACAVAVELAEIARREKAKRVFPVATAALRTADNGRSAARAIGAALGLPIRILSGKEEARTIFRAFQQRLDLGDSAVLGIDLGGGSLELAVGSRAEIRSEVTTELGVVRLHSEIVSHDPLEADDVRAIRKRVERELAPHRERLRQGAHRHAIATGGTARALRRLLDERTTQRRPRSAQPEVSLDELSALRKSLVRSTHGERLRMRGMRRSRADLLPVGAVVLETVARTLDLTGYQICDWGLREGILIDELL